MKKTLNYIWLFIAFAVLILPCLLVFTACGSVKNSVNLKGEWKLIQYAQNNGAMYNVNSKMPEEYNLKLVFDDGNTNGFGTLFVPNQSEGKDFSWSIKYNKIRIKSLNETPLITTETEGFTELVLMFADGPLKLTFDNQEKNAGEFSGVVLLFDIEE